MVSEGQLLTIIHESRKLYFSNESERQKFLLDKISSEPEANLSNLLLRMGLAGRLIISEELLTRLEIAEMHTWKQDIYNALFDAR